MKQEDAIREIKRLAREGGGTVTPSAVVDAARLEASPLHSWFEWDDSGAAEKWRLHQARQLIRVSVTYEKGRNDQSVPCRVFVSLTNDRKASGPGYRILTDVLSDEDLRQQLLVDARAEMKAFRVKYARLEELAEVFAAMERAEEDEADEAVVVQAPTEATV